MTLGVPKKALHKAFISIEILWVVMNAGLVCRILNFVRMFAQFMVYLPFGYIWALEICKLLHPSIKPKRSFFWTRKGRKIRAIALGALR